METMRLQIHANVRIRRIYFADRLYTEDEMPNEFKMYLPPGAKKPIKEKAGGKGKKAETKDEKPAEAKATEELELLDIKLDGEPSAAPPTPVGEGEGPEGNFFVKFTSICNSLSRIFLDLSFILQNYF